MRRVGLVALGVVLAAAALIGLIAFFGSRDKSQLSHESGPGVAYPDRGDAHVAAGGAARSYSSSPPTSGSHAVAAISHDRSRLTGDQVLTALERGNVIVFYGTRRAPTALVALARREAGPFDPHVAAAGQAVILARRPGTKGLLAAAWRHLQPAPSSTDPRLTAFVEYWLGRGHTSG